MSYSKEIQVSNPSKYVRSDYVEVDLGVLKVPEALGQDSLRLLRKAPNGAFDEVPFQIDYILGKNGRKRVMTFLSVNTPPGQDDYSHPSASFLLESGKPKEFAQDENAMWVAHYYKEPKPGEPPDGFNRAWDETREAYGIKLFNDRIESYFSLVPHPRIYTEIDYTGSATSIRLKGMPPDLQPNKQHSDSDEEWGDVLSPFEPWEASRWGQLTEMVFFPLPWDVRWFTRIPLLNKEYDLVWSNCGAMRAVFTMKSKPMMIRYQGAPFFKPDEVEVTCHLYRVLSVYPNKPYYNEQLFVYTDSGCSLSFRPYYYSLVHSPDNPGLISRQIHRDEHIPDYFAVWVRVGTMFYGYGFASDAHVRRISTPGDQIIWRLPHTHHHKSTHLFMYKNQIFQEIRPFHDVGHTAWYERVFKPLEVIPLANKYPLPEPYRL